MNIKGKVVLITGASEGIGRATALLFGEMGARLALSARSEERLNAVAEEAGGAFVVLADLTDPEQARGMVRATYLHFGRIDVLVNNAGQGMYCPVEKIKLEDLDHLINVNLYSPLAAIQEVVPIMRAQGGGSIVNVSSVVSKGVTPFVGGYAATKYALNGVSLTARNELGRDGIVVSLVLPKATATDFPAHTIHTEEMLRAVRGNVKRLDTAEDVALKILEAAEDGAAEVFV